MTHRPVVLPAPAVLRDIVQAIETTRNVRLAA